MDFEGKVIFEKKAVVFLKGKRKVNLRTEVMDFLKKRRGCVNEFLIPY